METTNNIKKAFPIASIFFLLYAVINITLAVIQAINSLRFYEAANFPIDNALPSVIAQATIPGLLAILYVLMGIFTLNTTKKPSIPYIVVNAIASFFALLTIPSTITGLKNALSTEYLTSNYINIYILNLVIAVALGIMLTVALIYAIIIKASKKSSKLSGLWFIFCVPAVIYTITNIAYFISLYLNPMEQLYSNNITYTYISVPAVVTWGDPICIAVAFIFVTLQFAKVNKSLATKKETETV